MCRNAEPVVRKISWFHILVFRNYSIRGPRDLDCNTVNADTHQQVPPAVFGINKTRLWESFKSPCFGRSYHQPNRIFGKYIVLQTDVKINEKIKF